MSTLRQQHPNVRPGVIAYVNLRETLGYNYFGEVMSFPIPPDREKAAERAEAEGRDAFLAGIVAGPTVMVRRVPGHPGTLEELPIACLEFDARYAKHKWVHYAQVAGGGQFPVDMLRYDCAAPVNFDLVEKFPGYIKGEPNADMGLAGLVVAKLSPHRDPHHPAVWTPERWGSFLWWISALKTERLEDR